MPNVDPSLFGLQDKQPAELDQRMRDILAQINSFPQKHEDHNVPLPLLQELSLVTGMLRRRTAGPPKVAKRTSIGPKVTSLKDFLS